MIEEGIEMERRGDVLFVTFRGLYHFAAHLRLRSEVRDELAHRPARAVVLNLLDAVMLMDESAHDAIVKLVAESPRLDTPIAMVVKPQSHATTASLCARLWAEGLCVVPFLVPQNAADWASRRRVRSAQAA